MLGTAEKKRLRGEGHKLKPLLTVGTAGVTEAVLKAATELFQDRELVKLRFEIADRAARKTAIHAVAESIGAELVHTIGKTGLYYRPAAEKA